MILYLKAQEPQQFYTAGTILAISCLTDLIDGVIARKFNMVSNLGKLLDPFADKLTQFTVTLCLCLKYPVLLPVLILIIAKETFQLIAFTINIKKGKALDGALLSGKICTTILFITLILLVLFPTISPRIVNIIAIVLLSRIVFAALKDYESQKAKGLDPVFHESNIGLNDTDVWK